MTSTVNSFEDALDNLTTNYDLSQYLTTDDLVTERSSFAALALKWILRLTSLLIILICPWANYKLIQMFQTHSYYRESSAKWYIIFKGVFDTIYMCISILILFALTFRFDIIHRNLLTCKVISYIHYVSDDLIIMMLTLLCIDRMVRITCSCRVRERISLIICIGTTSLFVLTNIHHVIRVQHLGGVCQKTYLRIGDYDFDIYYPLILTVISWTIIFIASVNVSISIYCDRTRRLQVRKQQEDQQRKIGQIFLNGGGPTGSDSDRVELINSADEWEDSTAITIEHNDNFVNRFLEHDQQDNIDLQITVCVVISSVLFLLCNLPNFILFIMTYILHANFSYVGYTFLYIALVPLLISHTVSYFIFKHLAARLFPSNSS